MYCWRGASIVFGIFLVIACSHPLEIKGEGDILSASGMRDCYLEDFRAGAESCSKNLVVGEYRETYHAVPRDGWEFVSWENCFDEGSALDQCRLDFDAGTVKKFWGETAAPLVAVFQQPNDALAPTKTLIILWSTRAAKRCPMVWSTASGVRDPTRPACSPWWATCFTSAPTARRRRTAPRPCV